MVNEQQTSLLQFLNNYKQLGKYHKEQGRVVDPGLQSPFKAHFPMS